MGMSNSSICVLAVVTSFALLTLTHEEADYYMGSERIVASRQSELSITLAGWISVLPQSRHRRDIRRSPRRYERCDGRDRSERHGRKRNRCGVSGRNAIELAFDIASE